MKWPVGRRPADAPQPSATENVPLADELSLVRAQIKALEAREEEIRAALIADPSARLGKHFEAIVITSTQRRISLDLLKQRFPEVASAVIGDKEVTVVRLQRRP